MMAGVFLDLESEQDEARSDAVQWEAEICRDPECAVNKLIGEFQGTGLSAASLDAIRADFRKDPLTIAKFEDAVACEEETPARKVPPYVHAFWMGIADFIAAMTPVIPFAFLPLDQAKYVCLAGTAVLLFLLGIGRARFGKRPVFRTVLETMAIAIAAGVAGVVFGWMIS
jgi:VIT1/CCC1 family predicted Fe2+/Mn2+ transporter